MLLWIGGLIILDTRRKILDASLELIKQRGFKGTTTRAIAEKAGVNEVTIFRNFKNKKGILKEAFEKTSYVSTLTAAIKEDVKWDLESDLLMLAKLYQKLLNENSDLIMISLKEAGQFPELEQEVVNVPRQIKQDLEYYFEAMKRKNKVIDTNFEAQALMFIWLNFSYFTNKVRNNSAITELSEVDYLTSTIKVFARGLTP